MNIDKLPDDCLLYIFNLFNRLEALLNCSEVCERWKGLVLERLRNVNYLTGTWDNTDYPVCNTIVFTDNDRLEERELSKWFPELKILVPRGELDVNVIANLTIKGLALTSYDKSLENVTFHNPSLEMLAISRFSSFFANEIQGPLLKQLYVSKCNVSDFADYAKYFPNLKRLHIHEYTRDPSYDKHYTGPDLEKLEILEMCFEAQIDPPDYYGFSLADHCPALKSAFHFIQTDEEFFFNSEIKNHFLEDLVLQFGSYPPDWSVLRRILSKYPNLKHLAIREEAISDENIPELLKLLPRITLIDIRSSPKVTEKSYEYIDWYCKHHNRSISLYSRDEQKINGEKTIQGWPRLYSIGVSIGRGFDFMKYCFLKHHEDLPLLLDPDE